MEVAIPYGSDVHTLRITLPERQVVVARSANPAPARTWEEIARAALAEPIGAPRLRDHDLRGKRVAIITDDWGRPTPAWRILPAVLEEVHAAGARDEDIVILTGSGVHPPMSHADLVRKLGPEVVARYRCLAHDAFDEENMAFMGFSPQGTPVWINRLVAQAEFRIAVGRVGPHLTHGYEGGAKMITPAVSHWQTVLRNHSSNFSPFAEYGSYEQNPSRREVDDIGRLVGLHFILNIAVNRRHEPFKGFAGHYIEAHRAGIAWGDREVWGAEIGCRADVTIASPGPGAAPGSRSGLDYAAIGTREGGTVIWLSQPAAEPEQPPAGFAAEMAEWSFERVILEHERRDQQRSAREISSRCKAIRGEYYARRPAYRRTVILAGGRLSAAAQRRLGLRPGGDWQAEIDAALTRYGPHARVLVLPDAFTTLPLERMHSF